MLSPRGQMTICKDNARGCPLPPGVYEHREEDERPHGENCCLNQETTLRDPSSADTLRKGTSVVYGLTVKLMTLWEGGPFSNAV